MENSSGKIVQFRLMQRMTHTGSNTPAMERECFVQLLDYLLSKNVPISMIVTDRHLGVTATMRNMFGFLEHGFDPWHVVKSIQARLNSASKRKDCNDIKVSLHFF
jgi:hypothetical protein